MSRCEPGWGSPELGQHNGATFYTDLRWDQLSLIWMAQGLRRQIFDLHKKVVDGRTKSGHDTRQQCGSLNADWYYLRK
jgi:hypothetical protein